jgi:exodeoxyribonuclease VII small subunit
MDKENAITFETALEKLEKAADNLKNDSITLEEALKNYEEGISYYKQCDEILNNAKQRIETYTKD